MIGMILASHREMAKGLLNSLELFFGGHIDQAEALCLLGEDDPSDFNEKLQAAIHRVDDGHGVMVFVDLMGGTPGNQATLGLRDEYMRENIRIITGMNLCIAMEFLGERMSKDDIHDIDLDHLMESGQNGIKCINQEMHLL